MFYSNPFKLLSEAAAADLLDQKVTDEVKDVIEELEEDLTNNVEEIKPEDQSTNGGIPITTEMCRILESHSDYDGRKYMLEFSEIMRICEDAEELDTDTGEVVAPDAGEVAEDICHKNGVDSADVVVVVNTNEVASLVETAILEAKSGKKSKSAKKAGKVAKFLKELKKKGFKVAKTSKKK